MARVDERERLAIDVLATHGGAWEHCEEFGSPYYPIQLLIEDYSPETVLADVRMLRTILIMHEPGIGLDERRQVGYDDPEHGGYNMPWGTVCVTCAQYTSESDLRGYWPCPTLNAMLVRYAAHPDFPAT